MTDPFERLSRWSKELADRALGWSFDDVKRLTVRYGGTNLETLAEVKFLPPPFGFALPRLRAVVRIRFDLDEVKELPPESGCSLYENGQPFGEEGAWRPVRDHVSDNMVDIWFQN